MSDYCGKLIAVLVMFVYHNEILFRVGILGIRMEQFFDFVVFIGSHLVTN